MFVLAVYQLQELHMCLHVIIVRGWQVCLTEHAAVTVYTPLGTAARSSLNPGKFASSLCSVMS